MEGLVLGRVGHYFNAGNGACATALVVGVDEATINVVGWERDGDSFRRTSVPVVPTPALEDTAASFHLTRDCPWAR